MYLEKSLQNEALMKISISSEKFGITNIGEVISATCVVEVLMAKDNRKI